VRFGPTLVVERDVDETCLDMVVPSMILQPLVENSIKHGLGRKIGEGRITLRATRANGLVTLEVEDNGVGLPQTRMEVESESGIGLRNVNERLRVIYGAPYQLKLVSQPGQGTQARIEIPRCTRRIGRPPRTRWPDIRALVVDDEQLAREEFCFLLGEAGGVEIAGQAADGVVALRLAGELRPDVVFLDVQMPGLTGFEVARRLLITDAPPELVFVTAFDQHAIEAFSVNAVDYVLKPVDATRLGQTLERLRTRLAARTGTAKLPLSPEDLEKVIEAVQARQGRRDQIAIRTGEKFTLVQSEELVHASLVDDSIVVATQTMYGTSNYRTLDELQAEAGPGGVLARASLAPGEHHED
jgi:DNA-binding LytR/AlgR family response regulator